MNYQWHYNRLVETRKDRVLLMGDSYENHHIVMKSMGGTDDPANRVMLTPREHFVAHWLLWRIHRNRAAASAFLYMSNALSGKKKMRVSSRGYEEAKLAKSSMGVSEETRLKLSMLKRGEKHPNWGKTSGSSGKKWSEESKNKLSEILRKKGKQSETTIEKRRKSLKGKKTFQPPYTEEGKKNISNSLKKNILLFVDNLETIKRECSSEHVKIVDLYLNNFSASEIAEIMNMKVQKIRSTIFMIKNKLIREAEAGG